MSIQLYEDGDLIKDTYDIVTSIKKGSDLDLPDDKKGEYSDDRKNRKVNGFVVDNKIMEGSYGVHTYKNSRGKTCIQEGIF